jgi:hypothetical protein
VDERAVVILFRMQTARSAGPYKRGLCRLNDTPPEPFCVVYMTDDAQSLEEQCGTSVHGTEALLTILQDQESKHEVQLICNQLQQLRNSENISDITRQGWAASKFQLHVCMCKIWEIGPYVYVRTFQTTEISINIQRYPSGYPRYPDTSVWSKFPDEGGKGRTPGLLT